MSNYVGYSASDYLQNSVTSRFLYGLRRTDEGELFLGRSDQLSASDDIVMNKPGEASNNFTDFEEGQDYYEGRDVYHNLVYANLNYEQFRWDNREMYYYVNAEGELVVRLNKAYTYPTGTSSEG
jgi:hypothetical protein|tara:strand:- start:1115 stop:1486 length:372 start_codon:yes stop_codon:yes gene_type:complete